MPKWCCVLAMPEIKPGDPPPSGYLQWHAWARIQHHAGLRQKRCRMCGLWRFPQEKCCTTLRKERRGIGEGNVVSVPDERGVKGN